MWRSWSAETPMYSVFIHLLSKGNTPFHLLFSIKAVCREDFIASAAQDYITVCTFMAMPVILRIGSSRILCSCIKSMSFNLF